MHGDPPSRMREKIADLSARRERFGLPPMIFGVAAYWIIRNTDRKAQAELHRITECKQSAAGFQNYQQWLTGTQLEQRVARWEYSVSNHGLRSGLVGTPQHIIDQLAAFETAGVNSLLLQCCPQLEEMDRNADQVIHARQSQNSHGESAQRRYWGLTKVPCFKRRIMTVAAPFVDRQNKHFAGVTPMFCPSLDWPLPVIKWKSLEERR